MTSPSPPSSGRDRFLLAGPWLSLCALALWTWSPHWIWLAVSASGAVAGATAFRGRAWTWSGGIVVLLAAILIGSATQRQVGAILADWDRYWNERVVEIEADLNEELDRRQEDGEQASSALASAWMSRGQAGLQAEALASIRQRARASALALYDAGGALVVWDGEHRGKVPEDVQAGERRLAYRDLPLFGYLYVSTVADDGSVAVAAYLMRAALPEGLRADPNDLVSRFYEETGERIRITEEDPGFAEVVWDLRLDDRLLSVVLERPAQDARATTVMETGGGRVAVMLVLAWVLLAVGSPRTTVAGAWAGAGLVAMAAWMPFDRLEVLGRVFDPSYSTVPVPVPVTLGRLAGLGLACFFVVAVTRRPPAILPIWAVGGVAAAAYPVVPLWLRAGMEPSALAGARLDWITYEVAICVVLALVTGLVLAGARRGEGPRGAVLGSLVLASLLAAAFGLAVSVRAAGPGLGPAAWGVPVALAAWGARSWEGWRGSALRWATAIVLAGTAAIPVAWGHRFEARVDQGEARLADLRSPDDPAMEDALLGFAGIADSLDRAGALDVSILYDGWLRSGLAGLGTPVRLQIHRRDGSPGEALRVGVSPAEPESLGELLGDGWAVGGVRLERLDEPDARYILTMRLADDDLVSAVVPPFPDNSGRSGITPLFRGSSASADDPLTVLPLGPGDAHHDSDSALLPARTGWQLETGIDFDGGRRFHAHYLIELPTVPLALARATLLIVLNLFLFGVLWLSGQALSGGSADRAVRISDLGISFRMRVTLALFGFFALANAIFGTLAFRTLDQASRRSAQVIADRVVEDAAGWYGTLGGEMERLAAQVGSELLAYHEAELRDGSVRELVELGFYEAWVPYDLHRLLETGEVAQEYGETSIGRWESVTAYRRLPDGPAAQDPERGDVLAAQVPLQAGATALQTSDVLELLGFVVLLGAALSFVLAMIASRALTRPIHALLVASESVGAGDLALRLPSNRPDEFGAVFRAFNRMVGRVRRARRQLVRTSRRTQLIMDEAAVGMVALDTLGRVTLVNPRAEDLLGGDVHVGRRLPGEGELASPLTVWLEEFLDGSADEATSDFQARERRVRVRVRRLGSMGADRGVVVALDDVTDELRAERVLAWGEMARQVAHEVKNPLTPIKLSIQHVRRAWDDRRPDFESILIRNADAMLSEIDRLAGIAQSFSRFGAPGEQAVPLEGVSIPQVVTEVMALYGGLGGGVRFEQSVDADLPLVVARTAELKEVLVNLLENARLAGQEGTTVTIVGRPEDRQGEGVVLEVVDDGHGIPEDVLPRVFEPQFSTRSTGTGLGLAIVQRVVRAWGGSVSVRSRVGEGTTVRVTMRVWSPPSDDEGGSSPRTVSS